MIRRITGTSGGRGLICIVVILIVAVQVAGTVQYVTYGLRRRIQWCYGPQLDGLCGWYDLTSVGQTQVIMLILLGLVLAISPLLARWCLQPVSSLVPVVSQMGPQNLGYRIRRPPSPDPVGSLATALDEMLDRIATGYEGQRRFAANASHELRTPLAVQRALIEVSMAQALSSDQAALLTTQLLQTNERNERLIDGLLVLSEADRGLAARLPCALDDVVHHVVTLHRKWAAEIGVTVTTDLRSRKVYGEDVLLERLVTNLLQNALKYNRANGTVHITVAESPALTVVNTGPVVPAAAVSSLFEPFKRIQTDRIDQSGGSGLGLTIARSITQAHDGVIQAWPGDDGGLRVQVELPKQRPD